MRRVILFLLIALTVSMEIYAGDTGKLYGIVKDKLTGEPLIGANVIILGTNLGASSDETGFYYINGILPGTYRVQFSMIGYQKVIFEQQVFRQLQLWIQDQQWFR